MVTRLWKGKKEMVTEPYFCGQVWNVERQLWDTVTKEYASEKDADQALADYLHAHRNEVTDGAIAAADAAIARATGHDG